MIIIYLRYEAENEFYHFVLTVKVGCHEKVILESFI